MGYQRAVTVILLGCVVGPALAHNIRKRDGVHLTEDDVKTMCELKYSYNKQLCEHYGLTTSSTTEANEGPTTTEESTTIESTPGKDLVKFVSAQDITSAGTTLSSFTISSESLSDANVERGDWTTFYIAVFLSGVAAAVGCFLIYRFGGSVGIVSFNLHFTKDSRDTICDEKLISV